MLLQTNHAHSIKFFDQLKLLKSAEQERISLDSLLRRENISYDDLVYQKSYLNTYKGKHPKRLCDFRQIEKNIPVVSFFSGCGGIDLGLEAIGFSHVACFEINELFCKTIRKNRPHWNVYGPPIHSGDVSNFSDVYSVLEKIISEPFEGLFVGGPPCQPFSIASNQRFSKDGERFKRIGFAHEKNGNLLLDYLKLIIAFKPKVFLIENVSGLRDIDGGKQIQGVLKMLKFAGYTVEAPFIVNASHYGIPQHRVRLFIVGSRENKVFSGLTRCSDLVGCGSVLLDTAILKNIHNTETRAHTAASILRYCLLDYGQRDQLGRVDRLDPTQPSKTVIAGGTNGGGRSHLHPEIPRTLSVRECARLQTFPDNYVFQGPTARQFTQVGNAVPPILAAQLGVAIMKSFF